LTELLVIVNVGWQQNEKSFEQINKGSPVTVMHTMYLTMKGKWEYFLVNHFTPYQKRALAIFSATPFCLWKYFS
jgi:hypothetical protein